MNRQEVEKSILSCIFLLGKSKNEAEREALETIFLEVCENDFQENAHNYIFLAAFKLFRANKPIEFITVIEVLESMSVWKSLNSKMLDNPLSYISELCTYMPTAVNYQTYLELLKKHNMADGIKAIAARMIDNADANPYEVKEQAISELSKLGEKTSVELMHYGAALEKAKDKLEQWADGKSTSIANVKTGWSRLNYFAPLVNGELIVIAARPGTGKSAFVAQLALHVAQKEEKRVAFFSLEMSDESVANRILLSKSKHSMASIQNNMQAKRLINEAYEEIKDARIYIETKLFTIEKIVRACKIQQKKTGLDLIIIDYLQLMSTTKKLANRNEIVTHLSNELKRLAVEMNVPVIALSQLNREVERGDNREPMLSDLRDSGAIEQDAYFVMFLHPQKTLPSGYREDIDKQIKAIVAKNRGGAIGSFYFKYIGDQYTFEQIDDKNEVYTAQTRELQIKFVDNPFVSDENQNSMLDDDLPY